MMGRKHEELQEKILDVDASMQGTISFKDPVNLRINGTFEGKLSAKGNLTIGENANVQAHITGDRIIIAGKVVGDIVASQTLAVIAPGRVKGNMRTPVLSVTEGAVIDGQVVMSGLGGGKAGEDEVLSLKEIAQYLEVETSVVEEWAAKRQIPAFQEQNMWKFRKSEVDRWVQEEKLNI